MHPKSRAEYWLQTAQDRFAIVPPGFAIVPPRVAIIPPGLAIIPPGFAIVPRRFAIVPRRFATVHHVSQLLSSRHLTEPPGRGVVAAPQWFRGAPAGRRRVSRDPAQVSNHSATAANGSAGCATVNQGGNGSAPRPIVPELPAKAPHLPAKAPHLRTKAQNR